MMMTSKSSVSISHEHHPLFQPYLFAETSEEQDLFQSQTSTILFFKGHPASIAGEAGKSSHWRESLL